MARSLTKEQEPFHDAITAIAGFLPVVVCFFYLFGRVVYGPSSEWGRAHEMCDPGPLQQSRELPFIIHGRAAVCVSRIHVDIEAFSWRYCKDPQVALDCPSRDALAMPFLASASSSGDT
jgi:hypothetical protein